MIYFTAIRLSGGSQHHHITRLRWRNPATGETSENSRSELVHWIKKEGGDARVKDAYGDVQVAVVDANPPYLRTIADGRYTDNLLSLPTF